MAQLTIINTASVATTTPGSVVRYTSTFTNTGQTPYTGITIASNISDVLDDATPNGDQTATSGTLTLTGTGISWTGSIPVGGTVTVTGTVTVNNPDTGNKVMASTLTTAAPGSNCPAGGTDPRCTVTVSVLIPGLTIVKTANVVDDHAGVGGRVHGHGDRLRPDAVHGRDVHRQPVGAAGGRRLQRRRRGEHRVGVLCGPGADVDREPGAGATATVTYSVTVDNPDTGDKTLANTVTSSTAGSNCPAGGADPRCTATVQDLVPGLTDRQTANSAAPPPGSVVHYTVTAANTGQTTDTGVSFTDSLAGVLDDAAYNGDAAATVGSVSFASPNLTWTGSLAPGATATVTFSVTVSNPDTGDRILSSAVTSAAAGSNCPSGGTAPACSSAVTVASLMICRHARARRRRRRARGAVHVHVHQHRADAVHRDHDRQRHQPTCSTTRRRNGDQTATSGTLTLTGDRDLLDREHPGRRHGHGRPGRSR